MKSSRRLPGLGGLCISVLTPGLNCPAQELGNTNKIGGWSKGDAEFHAETAAQFWFILTCAASAA
jgi:hypothetical protein